MIFFKVNWKISLAFVVFIGACSIGILEIYSVFFAANSIITTMLPSVLKKPIPITSNLLIPVLFDGSTSTLTHFQSETKTPQKLHRHISPTLDQIPKFNNDLNSVLTHRHLIDLSNVNNASKTVTISSFNILSRHYLWDSVYSYLPLDYTNWNKRFERLNKNFYDLTKISDILCFQEMEYQIYNDFWKDQMKNLGYDSIFQKKPKPGYWKKSSNMMDGVSIFYNKEKFDLLNYEQINFANHFKHSKIIDQTLDTQTRLNIRNTVAIIAVLKHKFTNEVLFVSNTHLYWSPKHDDVKLMQTYLLTNLLKKSIMRHYKISLDEVDSLLKQKNGPTIIMTGDFNSKPSSMVYKFMSNGAINKDTESSFDQDYGSKLTGEIDNSLGKFKSPYKDLYSKGIFTKTTYTQNFRDIIDYIWFADCNKRFKFTKVLGDIDPSYLENFEGFPNEEFPSDHVPILAQIEFD